MKGTEILAKLFERFKIKSLDDLSPDEKETYERYQSILAEEPITVDRIKQFCEDQIKIIERQWRNLDNSTQKNERLILIHTVYSLLLEVIASPKVEREKLEKDLVQLLEN